jgi:hypothetical protein
MGEINLVYREIFTNSHFKEYLPSKKLKFVEVLCLMDYTLFNINPEPVSITDFRKYCYYVSILKYLYTFASEYFKTLVRFTVV